MGANPIRILCVDDDPFSLEQLRRALTQVRGDFFARCLDSPRQALASHLERPADIVISDLRMDEPNGIELIAQMSAAEPDSIYILLSGDADLEAALAAVNEIEAFRFLLKPVDGQLLQLTLDAAVAELNLRRLRRISMLSHSAIQRLRAGVIFLSPDFRVVFANEPAQEILRDSGVFEMAWDGALRAATANETRRLHDFLRALQSAGETEGDGAVYRFPAAGPARYVAASIRYHCGEHGADGSFSLVLRDPKLARASEEAIATALSILPSEAKVVRGVADGLSVEEAASEAGVSVSTARTYLKNVFLKTGVSRQSELVRLVMLTTA
ncbi:DNA-binding response regulator [Amphiplicatus metriothermophilus]|uniref:Regulatory protein, luxR family n=1 Tax=Amphiplicatus metriothermophilus TaxID=1519374 RepID=A0A239PVH5_9PROT|nr:DNA-binding response regulator [Amphiplicatus metriothermophilus]MBB5519554.1 DNA-binding NarL/FixJ family response regulator [Amphiplicatus metriothermophilus]SNT74118.1 regulatory protein, luxR family [Amphiplicatus metriothermophilus]